jgi:nucleotide-binding universal stress UspA family protein
MFHRIAHANDGAENSFSALCAAVDLAALTYANLDVIFVEELIADTATDATERPGITERTARAQEIAARKGVTLKCHVFAGHPVQHIAQFAMERNADLLVIGATEHADLWERLFGTVADRVTHKVNCSVLVVREGGHDFA